MDYRMMEKLEPCPYNSSHQILPHRMAKHIIKCKKNYPDAQMKVCIFNAVHVVPVHQFQAHLLECENRELVEREVFQRPHVMQTGLLTKAKAEDLPVQDVASKAENWELECVQSSYCPEEHVMYKEFARPPPPGLSKGARKQWRLNEIERVNHLKNGIMVGDTQSGMNTCVSKVNTMSMNGGWSVAGAIPKSQDQVKCDLSSGESTTVMDQVAQKDRHPDTVTSKEPGQNGSVGYHIDKSQEAQIGFDMAYFIKEKRKLEKKLFEIKKLENMKMNLNQKLTEKEESKLVMKESIEKKLSNLLPFKNM